MTEKKKDYVMREEFANHQTCEAKIRDDFLWIAIFGAVAFSFVLMMAALGIYHDNFARDKQLRSLELARYNFTEKECVMWTAKTESLDRLNECVDAGCLKYQPCQLYCHTRQVPEMECKIVEKTRETGWTDLKCPEGEYPKLCWRESIFETYNETICAPKQECETEIKQNRIGNAVEQMSMWGSDNCWIGSNNSTIICESGHVNEKSIEETSGMDFRPVSQEDLFYNETSCTPITRAETYGCQDGELVRKSRELFG